MNRINDKIEDIFIHTNFKVSSEIIDVREFPLTRLYKWEVTELFFELNLMTYRENGGI